MDSDNNLSAESHLPVNNSPRQDRKLIQQTPDGSRRSNSCHEFNNHQRNERRIFEDPYKANGSRSSQPPENEIIRLCPETENFRAQFLLRDTQGSDDDSDVKGDPSENTAASSQGPEEELKFPEDLSAEARIQFLRAKRENQKQQLALQCSGSSEAGVNEEDREEDAEEESEKDMDLSYDFGFDDDSDNDDNLLFCKLKESTKASPGHELSPSHEIGDYAENPNAEEKETQTLDPGPKDREATVKHSAAAPKRKPSNRIRLKRSKREQERAKKIGLCKLFTPAKRRFDGTQASPRFPEMERQSKTRTTRLSEKELQSIFVHSDIIESARINSELPAAPGFTSRNRQVALEEMVASIPTEDQAEARSDKFRINEAIKQFDYKPKSDEKGGWKVKGLKSSLYHHQVMAVGWMRDRERSTTAPSGGLLCDVMGLGKTVTALANILDGRRRDRNEQRPPTLIIVPSQLVDHWMRQIKLHFDLDIFGDTFKYDSRTISAFSNPDSILNFDVIIATFEDIRKSYPKPTAPKQLKTPQDIMDWWYEHYDRELGMFHQVKWHRIVVDEGHYVKNPGSHTSMAVRALSGHFTWILSGTPLHNCVEEMFPYFNFLGVPNSSDFEIFKKCYCDGSLASRKRLVNILRSILHRKTHESRFMGRPLIEIPKITERVIAVNLCEAESFLYKALTDLFIAKINRLCQNGSLQWNCILTMFLKLRMFISHVLTAQDIVQYAVNHDDNLMDNMKVFAKLNSDDPSNQIFQSFLTIQDNPIVPETPFMTEYPGLAGNSKLKGDYTKMSGEFERFMTRLYEDGNWVERRRRLHCPHCQFMPQRAILTSCLHLYCEECFNSLAVCDIESDTETLECCSCKKVITEATNCGIFDKIDPHQPSPVPFSTPMKRKSGGQDSPDDTPSRNGIKRITRHSRKSSKVHKSKYGVFHTRALYDSDEEEYETPEVDDYTEDWIPIIGESTPGAKLTAVRELIQSFINKDDSVKIVVFTQFIDTTRLMEQICKAEKWAYTKITGKMTIHARNDNIQKFREDPDIKVMIASLKTGGVGLDLSVANKCILVDLWWNEAIEEQAYCRLFRIGQKREVEYVKIIVKDTIDDKLLDMQEDKKKRIQEVISPEVLAGRDTDKQLLEWFGQIQRVPGGGYLITPLERGQKKEDPIMVD